MGKTKKDKDVLVDEEEAKRLYQIYLQVQSGDKNALDGLFKQIDSKQICRADEINKEYMLSHLENVLDAESVLDNEKNKQTEEWIDSAYSKVSFQFPCLNKLLYKKKKKFLSEAKNTGYENGKKKKSNNHSKFYEGKYDVSDFNELMYETVIEVFNTKTDENYCLTLDGKKNIKYPICDGASLFKNISYFTSRKINKRAKSSCLDIFDTGYYIEDAEMEISGFDKYAYKKFLHAGRSTSRLMIYSEYLEWLKRYDVHKLFKTTSNNIKAIIETIMNCEDTFIADVVGDVEIGLGMRFVKQKMLQKIIKSRHGINIEQENISKDLELIEQRLLDYLFYALNYGIDKAEKSEGVYKKESERFLFELDKKAYIKIFSKISFEIYDKSIEFINIGNFDSYFRIIEKYEDMVIDIVSLEKGKKKYDMVNYILGDDDLVDDGNGALLNIANTIIAYYQKKEEGYRKDKFKDYKLKGFTDWRNSYWEAELGNEVLNIQLFSSKDVKKPIRRSINKEKLMVYCGYMNFYFCDAEGKVCYSVPKERRIISRANKNHEFFMYNVG